MSLKFVRLTNYFSHNLKGTHMLNQLISLDDANRIANNLTIKNRIIYKVSIGSCSGLEVELFEVGDWGIKFVNVSSKAIPNFLMEFEMELNDGLVSAIRIITDKFAPFSPAQFYAMAEMKSRTETEVPCVDFDILIGGLPCVGFAGRL